MARGKLSRVVRIGASALAGVAGAALVVVGLLGLATFVVALADPRGTQLANDSDPFGEEPSTLEVALRSATYCLCFGSGLLVIHRVRRPWQ